MIPTHQIFWNSLLPHPGMLLSEGGDITPLQVLLRKG